MPVFLGNFQCYNENLFEQKWSVIYKNERSFKAKQKQVKRQAKQGKKRGCVADSNNNKDFKIIYFRMQLNMRIVFY